MVKPCLRWRAGRGRNRCGKAGLRPEDAARSSPEVNEEVVQILADLAPAPGSALRYWFVMPIEDLQQAAQKIAGFINTLNKLGGMKLKFRITAGDGAKDPAGLEARQIYVELGGPDTPLLTQHNGELLRALETIAAQMLRLDQREHDLVSFDAASFKAIRAQELKMQAEVAADKVIRSGVPFAFPPMNSRERRLLHMSFREIEGVETASSGEGLDRFLAVFPAGKTNLACGSAGAAAEL
jgi:spoIIIJ-associated protein